MRGAKDQKYNLGNVLIIQGDDNYTGATYFSAMGTYLTGVDLVSIFSPYQSAEVLKSNPQFIVYNYKQNLFDNRVLGDLIQLIERRKYNTLVISGFGRNQLSQSALKRLLKKIKVPVVLDGDGGLAINKCEKGVFLLNKKEAQLKGITPRNIKKRAKEFGGVVALKGYTDYISDGNKVVKINYRKNSHYLIKAGTGDILAGMVGGFIGKGMESLDAVETALRIMKDVGSQIGENEEYYTHEELIKTLQNHIKEFFLNKQ